MNDCCKEQVLNTVKNCPINGNKGKKVSLTTLKSLLTPEALTRLNPEVNYYFCDSEDCQVVYFSTDKQIYNIEDIKIRVWQKSNDENTAICYCFDWTKIKIKSAIIQDKISPVAEITEHIKAKRCGCEFNNPEGRCCLKNISQYITNFSAHTS
ncbi:MAG: (2Fe-2S)-binding protein [Cyanobacterium sp. T60_A2020_053]|nr:(2Fe-2S)-binding protein [Cyanobacterium sp. T60_A2020_053]